MQLVGSGSLDEASQPASQLELGAVCPRESLYVMILTEIMKGVFVTISRVKWKDIMENILFYCCECCHKALWEK